MMIKQFINWWAIPSRILGLLLLLAVLLSLSEFFAPISGDTAIYAYAGRMLAHGRVLYRDVWDFKSPGIYYLFAAIFRILPDSLFTLRVFALAWGLLAGILFWLLARLLFASVTALVLTFFFLLWTNLAGNLNADGPFPETFMPLIMVSVYFLWFRYQETRRAHRLVAAGFGAGCLILLKQTAFVTLIGLLLVLLVHWLIRSQSFRQTVVDVFALAAGTSLALVPWALYFWLNGTWGDLWQAVFEYPRLYAATTPFPAAAMNALNLFLNMVPFLGLLYVTMPLTFVLLVRGAKGKELKSIGASPYSALILWGLLETVSIAAPGRFYERYLLEPLPAYILIAGIAIQYFIESCSGGLASSRAIPTICLGAAAVVSTTAQLPRALHWIDKRALSSTATRSELFVNYLYTHASATDTIFAWGDPRIPYVTHHPSGIKWINLEPFRSSQAFVTPSVIAELLLELETNPPRYFVESPAIISLAKSYLRGTAVETFVQQHYRLTDHVGDADLYEYQGGLH